MNYLPGISFLIIVIIGVAELLLSATWSRIYFSTGIPIVTRIIPVDFHHTNVPSDFVLDKKFKSDRYDFTKSLIFRELDTNRYGFRESLNRRSTSLMHGLLIFDDKNNQVIVKGFLNWTPVCFVLLAVYVPSVQWLNGVRTPFEPAWLFALAYFGILFIILTTFIWVDYVRVSAVAQFAAQWWSRKHLNMGGG